MLLCKQLYSHASNFVEETSQRHGNIHVICSAHVQRSLKAIAPPVGSSEVRDVDESAKIYRFYPVEFVRAEKAGSSP